MSTQKNYVVEKSICRFFFFSPDKAVVRTIRAVAFLGKLLEFWSGMKRFLPCACPGIPAETTAKGIVALLRRTLVFKVSGRRCLAGVAARDYLKVTLLKWIARSRLFSFK